VSNAESTTSAIQVVPFHDDTLLTLVDERTGKEYVLPKPMTELFGLAWGPQLRKMKRNPIFVRGMTMMVIPSVSGEQETVLLERRLVQAWLLSINTTRIKETLREKLLTYQEECAKVLDDYFTKGHAENPHLQTRGDMLVQMAVAYREQEQRIIALETERDTQRESLITQQAAIIETQRKALAGFLMAARAEAKADVALEDLHRMTVEEYVIKNGLTRQYHPPDYQRIGKWVSHFCQQWGLEVPKAPVVGKPWDSENAYPLQAFAAFARYEQQRPKQITLVKEMRDGNK
jgi:P22_AR N-terminal domain